MHTSSRVHARRRRPHNGASMQRGCSQCSQRRSARATQRRGDAPTPRLPLRRPHSARALSAHTKLLAKPNSSVDTSVPARPRMSAGRRPTRSESQPQSGADTNCAML
jgi:hypothetical protein